MFHGQAPYFFFFAVLLRFPRLALVQHDAMIAVAADIHVLHADYVRTFYHGDLTGAGAALCFGQVDLTLGIQQGGSLSGGIDRALGHRNGRAFRFRCQRCAAQALCADIDVICRNLSTFRGIQAPGVGAVCADIGIMQLHFCFCPAGEDGISPFPFGGKCAAVQVQQAVDGCHDGILAQELAADSAGRTARLGKSPVGQRHISPVLDQQGIFIRLHCRIAVCQRNFFSGDDFGSCKLIHGQRSIHRRFHHGLCLDLFFCFDRFTRLLISSPGIGAG